MQIVIERGEYKGSPTVSLRKNTEEMNNYPFSFGVAKAKLLLAALAQEPDFLAKFVQECGK